jgi:hypothetical protein
MAEQGEYQGVTPDDLEDLKNVDHASSPQVGDTLVVTAVDDNGRVHWEAATPSGTSVVLDRLSAYPASGPLLSDGIPLTIGTWAEDLVVGTSLAVVDSGGGAMGISFAPGVYVVNLTFDGPVADAPSLVAKFTGASGENGGGDYVLPYDSGAYYPMAAAEANNKMQFALLGLIIEVEADAAYVGTFQLTATGNASPYQIANRGIDVRRLQ